MLIFLYFKQLKDKEGYNWKQNEKG